MGSHTDAGRKPSGTGDDVDTDSAFFGQGR
jgi:hypothetical protein